MTQEFLAQRAKYRSIIARRYHVSEDVFDEVTRLLAPLAEPIHLRKGEYLQRIGSPAQHFCWLTSGVARSGFITEGGNEVTLHFMVDGETAASHGDLLRARAGELAMHFVVAETALRGYRMDWLAVSKLTEAHSVLRDYYLKVSERGILTQGRRIYISAAPAQGRLAAFRREYPGLEARISQKVMASFLGITPQYMSQLLRVDSEGK